MGLFLVLLVHMFKVLRSNLLKRGVDIVYAEQ